MVVYPRSGLPWVYEVSCSISNVIFYRQSMDDARGDRVKSYVFGDPEDDARNQHLLEIMRRHRIEVYQLNNNLSLDGKAFSAETSYVVPVEQT